MVRQHPVKWMKDEGGKMTDKEKVKCGRWKDKDNFQSSPLSFISHTYF
ncbi:hypothetical protein [Candidatus Kuenenia sp.]